MSITTKSRVPKNYHREYPTHYYKTIYDCVYYMYVHPVYGVPHVLKYRVERHQQIATSNSGVFSTRAINKNNR